MFTQVQDYTTVGQNPLTVTRYYNSMGDVSFTSATAFGANWRSNYDRYLHIINPSAIYGVTVERPDGQYINFSSTAGTYTTDSDLDYSLTKSGTTWTLTSPDDTKETYAQSGGNATLQTIKRPGGYTQTMHYTGSLLSSVTDSYSRALGLTYSSVGRLTGVTTPDTLTLAYGYIPYMSSGLLTSVSYNTVPATHQTYLYESTNYPTALTGITDENSNRYATWAYDGKGRAASSQLAGGVNFTSVSYDDTTGNRTVQGPLGNLETYQFSYLQGVPKVSEIDRAANGTVSAASRLFTYDVNGYLASATDWNGNLTGYTNNSHGLPTQIVFASSSPVTHTTTVAYDPTWVHLAKTITTPGLTTTNTYDTPTGNLLFQSMTDTTTQSIPYSTNGQVRGSGFTYTSTGLLLTAQLPRTDVTAKTTYGYTGGVLTSITDALSHVTTINTYRPGGLPLTLHDQNSVLTTLAYNPRNWLTSSILTVSGGSLTTGLAYDSAGNLTKTTLPDASYLAYGYDNAHRLTAITNRLGESLPLTYDSAGDLTQTLWKNASAVTKRQHTATYDALGRLATDIGGMSQTTTYGYDSQGNATSIQSPLMNTASQAFDALNRRTGYTDAMLYYTSTSYDAHDRPTAIKDPKNNLTKYVYDGFGEVIQETSPDRGTWVWHFDKDGNVSSQTDGNAAVTNMTYDALDRILTRAYPADSTLNVAFTYDQAGHGKGIGRLTSLTDQPGTLSRSYEERGLITSEARVIGTSTYTSGYTYESAGRLASITYPASSAVITYTRDNAGQITGMGGSLPAAGGFPVVTTTTHLPFGPLASLTWGNGVTDARTFDLDYRMTSVKDTGTSGNLQYASYGYDADNNMHTFTDNVTSSNNLTVNYDAIDRISQAGGSVTYDSNSNILTQGSVSNTVPATSDKMSVSNGGSYLYDSAGNLTSLGCCATQTYSKANRLATSNTNSYAYDAFGQRLKSVAGSSTTIEQYDPAGHQLIENTSGNEGDYGYLDDMPIVVLSPTYTTISELHTDRLGMVRVATDPYQAIVWQGNYSPYGAIAPSPTNVLMNLRYPGMRNDPNGYYHNGFRDYNVGDNNDRYLQPDPIGLAGGLNPYNYAQSNPYKWTDPSGLYVGIDDVAFTAGGALVGVAGQGLSDLLAGHISSMQDYTGSAIGGAVGGETLLYTGPIVAGAAGGFATNLSKQLLNNLTPPKGAVCTAPTPFNPTSLAVDTAIGGFTGLIPGVKIPGITAGRGSYNAVFNQMTTKLSNGTISNLTTQTALKMVTGRAVDTAVVPGMAAGATAGTYIGPYIPGYSGNNGNQQH